MQREREVLDALNMLAAVRVDPCSHHAKQVRYSGFRPDQCSAAESDAFTSDSGERPETQQHGWHFKATPDLGITIRSIVGLRGGIVVSAGASVTRENCRNRRAP